MSFNEYEISSQDGRPVTLYLFEWGNTQWAYTSADREVVLGSLEPDSEQTIYEPITISDKGMVQGSSSQNDFTVTVQADIPLVALFRGTPPAETIWLTVRRIHYDDADMQAPIYWKGTVSNVKRKGAAEAEIIGAPLTASFRRAGLRLCWTRECPHFLYDPGCKVDPNAYRLDAAIVALTGSTATLDTVGGRPDQYFRGGYLEWEVNADGTQERRMIEAQTGNVLTMFGSTDGLMVGMNVSAYPGCSRTADVCKAKFDNLANYGGFDFMPSETPFGAILF